MWGLRQPPVGLGNSPPGFVLTNKSQVCYSLIIGKCIITVSVKNQWPSSPMHTSDSHRVHSSRGSGGEEGEEEGKGEGRTDNVVSS